MNYNLLAISGSLRTGSYNTALVRAFQKHVPEGAVLEIADISSIPLFNQDFEKELPVAVVDLKKKISSVDGIIISTPEYSRSIPGVLKNVLDWTCRPYGESAWKGKPVFVVGATSGHVGTAVAQAVVKSVLLPIGAYVLGTPEFYLMSAQEKFDAEGTLIDENTKEHITKAYGAFLPFVQKFK